ncbi:MAG: universal stress protein [Comamonadaceae bacterium]|nr:universal stress protein [Comamonadaceae bacterium]
MLAYLAAHDEWLGAAARVHRAARGAGGAAARRRGAGQGDAASRYYEDEAEKVLQADPHLLRHARACTADVRRTRSARRPTSSPTPAEKGDYDLLVLGSHGHGTLANLVLGSVATKVLAQLQARRRC